MADKLLTSRYRELEVVHELSQTILVSPDLQTILEKILEKAVSLGPFDLANIRLVDPGTGILEPVLSRGFENPKNAARMRRAVRNSSRPLLVSRVIDEHGPLLLQDIQAGDRMRTLKREGIESAVIVPVRAEEEVLGDLTLGNRTRREFQPDEIRLLQTVGTQLGIAVQKTRLYEELKERLLELDRANKVKEEFLSVMSHELRTPLNVVLGYAGMMRDKILGDINPEQERGLEKIFETVQEQLTMVNSILYATSIEAATLMLDPEEVTLVDFLDRLGDDFIHPSGKQVELKWDFATNLPGVRTDSSKLKIVLQNLIQNAIKFTANGQVTVSARYLVGTEEVEFKIADTGVGIAGKNLSVIFEKFKQIDSSETRLYGGVGLGLYIVKKFTELLGGTVAVESELGRGSIFTVTIPLKKH